MIILIFLTVICTDWGSVLLLAQLKKIWDLSCCYSHMVVGNIVNTWTVGFSWHPNQGSWYSLSCSSVKNKNTSLKLYF
jgi:hypothetical protein